MSDYQTITFHQSGPTAQITLNRPQAANTMDDTMTRELASAAARCSHGNVKGGHPHGCGPILLRGWRLGRIRGRPEAGALHQGDCRFTAPRHLHVLHMDAVLITVVNGVAAGAGLSIAASGDIVLAAESATFTMAYTRVGLTPDGSASYYLPRLIGIRRTQELMLTNRTLTAQQAAQWGIVTEVVSDDQIATRADELAAVFAASATKSNAGVKKLLLSRSATDSRSRWNSKGR